MGNFFNKNLSQNNNKDQEKDIWDLGESLIETKEEGENIRENNKGFIIRPE